MIGVAALPCGVTPLPRAAFFRRFVLWIAALVGAAALSGCATYSSSFGAIERDLASQRYDNALQATEKQAKSKTDRVLYLLNKGMILRMKHDFAGSNQALEAAKAEMERLYAVSVSENTFSFIVNDATVSYGGDDYEQVLVHLYMALNYLELGKADDARVEALQVDEKLREIGANIPGDKFTEDAFSRYLSGLIFDERAEWSDALIDYRKAYVAYRKYQAEYGTPMPTMLKYDLLRLTNRQGLADEAARYRKEFGISPEQPLRIAGGPPDGELVFVLNNGLAPIKREKAANAVDPATGTLVRIALPYYESRPNSVASARISAAGKQAGTEIVENIDAIARQSLDSRMPAIIARSIARAVIKTAAVNAAARKRKNGNDKEAMAELIGGLALQVAAVATERADTRSWLTLPADIQLARLPLPPGSYTVKVELLDSGGQTVATREYPGVVIAQAHKTYLTQHWVPPQLSNARSEK